MVVQSNISTFFLSLLLFSFRKVALRLSQFLDKLITLPSIRSQESFMKLRVLLAQGESHEEFKASMHELDVSLKCNAIWENDSVAYRCNTCALTPCMSLCASCFQAANHEGHDFTRFFSREGGACDCGNADVIRPMGFCPRHGENAVRPPSPSPLIVSLPRHIFLKLVVCLFLEWRGYAGIATHGQFLFIPKNFVFDLMLTCRRKHTITISFEECVNYGGPMRQAMAEILLDKDLYLALTERNSDDLDLSSTSEMSLDWKTRKKFYDDRMTIFSERLLCECLLDELLFWVTRMNFPQNLINFSLSMLSEPNYTDALSTRFFTWYPLVANCVRKLCLYQQLRQRNSDVIQSTCSRLIHISVQMLSSEVLCRRLNSKCDLVNIVLNTTMNQHGYWFVMGDLQNLLAHSSVAIDTVLHPTAFSCTYVNLLNRMQGMNVNWRIIRGEHRENDNADLVQRSFTLEFEALALTMFNFVNAISQQQHYVAAVAFFDKIFAALSVFILPLLEHLSTALTHFNDMELFRNHVEDFRKDEQFLRRILLHPLKIQVARAEYHAGMWVRNGNQLRVQAIIYAKFFNPLYNIKHETCKNSRLMSEIVVLLTNCGASTEAALRSEMVNALASGPFTYSRLRSIIAEKGSRGAEIVDPLFDTVLNSVSPYIDIFSLYLFCCFIWQMNRSYRSQIFLNQDRVVFVRISNSFFREREMLGNEEKILQMWIPYQLSDFSDSTRHESLRNIARILLCERFVQLCIVVLEAVINLLFKTVSGFPNVLFLCSDEHSVIRSRKVVQLPLLIFVLFLIECEKRGTKDKILKKTIAGDFDKKRIVGGAAEYFARLVTYISKWWVFCLRIFFFFELSQNPRHILDHLIGCNPDILENIFKSQL
ncbi:unnamed protein product [Angiostrongylus costaricensis]|uniref:E3 ubiquitin-protein ligase n=1 Tax=Angiostrongylus costaricensis TaxID=334426 RepID=A0A158PDC3_ANGCS|nr:unnamed protein product [Angiostrongylus costaricensis]